MQKTFLLWLWPIIHVSSRLLLLILSVFLSFLLPFVPVASSVCCCCCCCCCCFSSNNLRFRSIYRRIGIGIATNHSNPNPIHRRSGKDMIFYGASLAWLLFVVGIVQYRMMESINPLFCADSVFCAYLRFECGHFWILIFEPTKEVTNCSMAVDVCLFVC